MANAAVILAISGSLRAESYNTKLVSEAVAVAPVGAKLVAWGDLVSIPAFSEDGENDAGPAVRALRAAIAEAGAVLIATPEYNGSLPGQLKNALDWASRPFRGFPPIGVASPREWCVQQGKHLNGRSAARPAHQPVAADLRILSGIANRRSCLTGTTEQQGGGWSEPPGGSGCHLRCVARSRRGLPTIMHRIVGNSVASK